MLFTRNVVTFFTLCHRHRILIGGGIFHPSTVGLWSFCDVRVRTRQTFSAFFFHKSKPLLMPYPRIWLPDLTLFAKGSQIDKVRQFLSPVPSVTRGSTSLVETFDETFSDFFFSVWSLHIGAFHEKCCHIFHSLPKASYFDRRRPWGRISVKKRGISQKLTPLAKSVYCEKKLVTSTHT